jgi:hypothetical protein
MRRRRFSGARTVEGGCASSRDSFSSLPWRARWAPRTSPRRRRPRSRYRAEHGLPPVKADPWLLRLAAEQAAAMAPAGVLEHDVEKPFGARMFRYDSEVAVENIAGGTRDFTATLDLWKRSPEHDANLRRTGVTRFGIASAAGPDSKYRIFWALIMAGRESRHGPAARPARPARGEGPPGARADGAAAAGSAAGPAVEAEGAAAAAMGKPFGEGAAGWQLGV